MVRKLLFLVILSACASPTFEKDRTSSDYQAGKRFPVTAPSGNSFASQAQPGVPMTSPSPEAAAGAAAVASGAALTSNPQYYVGTSIRGRCFIRAEGAPVDLPCQNVTIVLKKNGKELSKAQVSDGNFAFHAERNTRYQLELDSQKYKWLEPSPSREYFAGDEIIIQLQPLKK